MNTLVRSKLVEIGTVAIVISGSGRLMYFLDAAVAVDSSNEEFEECFDGSSVDMETVKGVQAVQASHPALAN